MMEIPGLLQAYFKFGGDCLDGDNTVEGAMPALGKTESYLWFGLVQKGLFMLQVSKDKGETWLEEENIYLTIREDGILRLKIFLIKWFTCIC